MEGARWDTQVHSSICDCRRVTCLFGHPASREEVWKQNQKLHSFKRKHLVGKSSCTHFFWWQMVDQHRWANLKMRIKNESSKVPWIFLPLGVATSPLWFNFLLCILLTVSSQSAMHYSDSQGSIYLHTYRYCICTQLSRSIPVDFLISECAEFALEHLEHPFEEWFLFSSLKLETQANRQADRRAWQLLLTAPPPHPPPIFLLFAPRPVLCHWRGVAECE